MQINKILENRNIAVLVLLAVSAYVFFFQLGSFALTDPDETFYAQTAKEMHARNEWLTPYMYDKPQFEKPILFYDLVNVAYKIFGVNEFAARFPSAVFGLLGVLGIYLFGSVLFSRRAGFFAGIVLATNVEYIMLSRGCVTDMVLSTFMLFGAGLFYYGYIKDKPHAYILSSVSFALATLTKGPIAIMLAGAVIVLFLISVKDLKALGRMPLGWMLVVFLAVAAPWYILEYKLHGKVFIDLFFGFHNVTRFLEAEHKIGSQFYYNIPVVFAGLFPWSAFLPFGFWHIFNKIRNTQYAMRDTKKGCIFIMVWFFVIFTFFSISSTKLPTYIFPSFISLALIVGLLWDDFLKKGRSRALAVGMQFSYYLLFAVVVLGAIGLSIFIRFDYPAAFNGVIVAGGFLVLGFILSFAAFIAGRFLTTFFMIAYAVVVFLYPLNELILPDLQPHETGKEISRELLHYMKPDELLGSESHYMAGLAFYTGKFPLDIDKHHILVEFLNSKERVWCLLKEKNHRELYDPNNTVRFTRPTYAVYKLGKKTIVTNQMPQDGVYLLKRDGQ